MAGSDEYRVNIPSWIPNVLR